MMVLFHIKSSLSLIKRNVLLLVIIILSFTNPILANPSYGQATIITKDIADENGEFIRQVRICEVNSSHDPVCELIETLSASELQTFANAIYFERIKNEGLLAGTVALTLFTPFKQHALAVLKTPKHLYTAAKDGRGMTSVLVSGAKSIAPSNTHKIVGVGVAGTMTSMATTNNQNPVFTLSNCIYESIWYPGSKEAIQAILQNQTESLSTSVVYAEKLKETLVSYYQKLRE